jgi:hypothetical protein
MPACTLVVIDGTSHSQPTSRWVPAASQLALAQRAAQDRLGQPVDLDDHRAGLVETLRRSEAAREPAHDVAVEGVVVVHAEHRGEQRIQSGQAEGNQEGRPQSVHREPGHQARRDQHQDRVERQRDQQEQDHAQVRRE